MTLMRLAATMGFCFMLVSVTLLGPTFQLNQFGERAPELWPMFFGFCLIPLTIYS